MKMSKISCDIIKDLLPLYIDGVCSSDSIDIIEEHLKECPICETEFVNMQNNTDIKTEIDKDIDKAVKCANKKIKKGKKKVAITTISIISVILLVIGIISFLIIPVKLAQQDFYNDNLAAVSAAYEIELNDKKERNFKGQFASFHLNKELGKYTYTKQNTESETLEFDNGKSIAIVSVPFQKENIKTFKEQHGTFGFDGTYSRPYFMPLVKKGIENMGIDPDTTFWNFDIYIHMIKNGNYDGYLLQKSPKEFSMWYAYYALWGTVMPTHATSYITIKSDDLKCYGYCSFNEDSGTHYFIEFQGKDNFSEHFSIIANGFTKEEIIELVESIKMN